MTEDISTVKCGCGFSATGPNQTVNNEALQAHQCFEGQLQGTTWYHGLFSFEGIVVLFVAGWIIVEIVKALSD